MIRVWKFHARPTDRKQVHAIHVLTSRYYNQLVQIERARSARFAAIRRELAPELAALEDAWLAADGRAEELVREVKRARQARFRATSERSLHVSAAFVAELDSVKAERSRLNEAAKPLRRAFSERMQPAREEYRRRRIELAESMSTHETPGPRIRERANAQVREEMLADPAIEEAWRRVVASDAAANEAVKRARSACGLSPGIYLEIEAAVERAIKDRAPAPPQHRRHDGKVAVVLGRGVTFKDLLAGTSKAQLRPHPKPGRKGRSEEHYLAKICVGREAGVPVWLTAEVRIHRRPADDVLVKAVWLTSHKRGETERDRRFELQLVLEATELGTSRPVGAGHGGHVQIGWSSTAEGVRVASWDDGELVVPYAMIDRNEHADRLIGYADRYWVETARLLRRWQADGSRLRWDWLERGTRGRQWVRGLVFAYAAHELGGWGAVHELWAAWRAVGHRDLFLPLHEAARWLRGRGLSSRTAHLAWWLYTWARKDRHLRQVAQAMRVGFENARDALFRMTAIGLATQYETLSIDNYSIARLKERPAVTSRPRRKLTLPGEASNETAKRRLQAVAPGRFREILCEVMGPRCAPCERPGDECEAGPAREPRKRSRNTATGAAEEVPSAG